MVDVGRLRALLERMAEETVALRAAGGRDDADLLSDPQALPAIKYHFIVAIESAIDVAQHVIASERLPIPASFADAFAVLVAADLIDDEVAASMADAARFRNLLVHNYADVDDQRVVRILRSRVDDLDRFRIAAAGFVTG